MKKIILAVAILAAAPLLPTGAAAQMAPTIQVMPAANKPFPVFQQDDANCRAWADSRVAGMQQQANNQMAGNVLGGAVLGAGIGAAFGGGRGAAIGAGAGAVTGTAAGANAAAQTQAMAQQQYDNAYAQCMYSRGNQVPGYQSAAPMPPPPPPRN
jgi:uncharacterized protein YcfJ